MTKEIEREAQLKEALGDDYEEFVKFKEVKAEKAKRQEAKAIALKMCNEDGGKYYTEYSRLQDQLDAIWDKAMKESESEVGLEVSKK